MQLPYRTQAISDAAAYPSRAKSTECLAFLFTQQWQPVADGPTGADLAYASTMAFAAPVLEETLFTGFLLNGIARLYGFVPACLGVAVCFTAWHTFKLGITVILIPLFFAGLTYAMIRVWSGSLLLAVLAHCTINGVIFIPKWVVAAIYFSRL